MVGISLQFSAQTNKSHYSIICQGRLLLEFCNRENTLSAVDGCRMSPWISSSNECLPYFNLDSSPESLGTRSRLLMPIILIRKVLPHNSLMCLNVYYPQSYDVSRSNGEHTGLCDLTVSKTASFIHAPCSSDTMA